VLILRIVWFVLIIGLAIRWAESEVPGTATPAPRRLLVGRVNRGTDPACSCGLVVWVSRAMLIFRIVQFALIIGSAIPLAESEVPGTAKSARAAE
jgi:hypothetical protein